MPAMFQRRHMDELANALLDARRIALATGGERTLIGMDLATRRLERLLADSNSRFDAERWRRACGMDLET